MDVVKSLEPIFKPRSIAVIGATMRDNSLGRTIIKNLFEYEFNGKIFPVNPKYDVIHSSKCFNSVLDIPDHVDLAVIMVNKHLVLHAAEECGKKGVKGLVVLSAGFKEVGGKGVELEDQLLKIVRKYKMRMVGPNCMGVINTNSKYNLNATFAPELPKRGNIGFLSQSGALGVAIISATQHYNLGLSTFVSVGNKTDVHDNDMLEYWGEDPDTDIILLYLESLGDPNRFTSIARRITKNKPIIALKSGRTLAGAKAASSHTGAIAGADIAAEALLEQCGIIRVNYINEMFELALAFSKKKYPKSNRVAIVSNGGGPAIMAADACDGVGLDIPTFSKSSQDKMRKFLSVDATTRNPVDLIASGGPVEYEKVLNIVAEDKDVDAILAISVTPPTLVEPRAVLDRITKVADNIDKPLLTVVMGKDPADQENIMDVSKLHGTYQFPEPPAKAIAEMLRYAKWQEKPAGKERRFKVDKIKVNKILKKNYKEEVYLSDDDVMTVFNSYGLKFVPSATAKTHLEAADAAKKIGFPVVLKAIADKLVHKTDVGGVQVDLRNRGEVIEAYYDIKEKINKHKPGSFKAVRVQKMVQEGKEVILGTVRKPQYGNLIMFGLGGIFVEIIKDVQFRTAPITDLDAEEMISSIKGYPILTGIRGDKGVDIDKIKEYLQRLSKLVTDYSNILSIDVNPFMVSSKAENSFIVDARIQVGPNSE